MQKTRMFVLLLALASAAAAIGGGLATAGSPSAAHQAVAPATSKGGTQVAAGVDPRSGGFEVVLGEWAISPEAKAIRPGPVTFVIRNAGKFHHGLEIKIERRGGRDGDHDADDHGRHGGDDDAESIELRPGQVTRMTLDLAPGVYEIECFVSNHDDRGMYGLLEVREDAPLVSPPKPAARSTVDIAAFAFKPSTLRTTVGSTVTWRNSDAAPHTATGSQFSSPQLGKGGVYRRRFMRAGTYAYLCALHPGMRGKVIVAARGAP